MFIAQHCTHCRHDAAHRGKCDRVLRSMLYETTDAQYPQEWRWQWREPHARGFETWCGAFAPVVPRKRRARTIPGQGLLLS